MKKYITILILVLFACLATAYTPPNNSTVEVHVTPTITNGTYTAGKEVGGLMTFAAMTRSPAFSGVVQSIHITCKTVQTGSVKLYVFSSNPTNSTWADNTTASINAADIPFLVGEYTLGATDSGLGTNTIYTLDGVAKAFQIPSSNTTLYGIMTTPGALTTGSTSDYGVYLTVIQD